MGQPDNFDPVVSGLREVLQPLTIKTNPLQKGQNSCRINDLLDSKKKKNQKEKIVKSH